MFVGDMAPPLIDWTFVLAPPTDSARIKLTISLSLMNFYGLLGVVAVEKPAN